MGFKRTFLNKFALFNKKNGSSMLSEAPKTVQLHDVLSEINTFNATMTTPQSRTSLVYNFGEKVDLTLSFAKKVKNKFDISKGLAIYKGKTFITLDEWNQLEQIDLPDGKLLAKNSTPALILSINENYDSNFIQLLRSINQYAGKHYPLVIGIDAFNNLNKMFLDMSVIKLLSTVYENKFLRFVFYYRGSSELKFLNIPLQAQPSSLCPKGFFDGISEQERYLNSMIELRNLLESVDTVNAKLYRDILTILFQSDAAMSNAKLHEIARRKMNIYDNVLKTFLLKTNTKYRMGYCLENGGKYVEFKGDEKKFCTTERYVLVSRDTILMLNSELVTKIKCIDISDCKIPIIKWYDGVPGCGKTSFIVSRHTPGKDLVLSQTRAGIKDIRDAVLAKYGQLCSKQLFTDYRTVSSFIINHTSNKTYDRIYIDEALMMHAGYIGYVVKLCGASEVIALGDSKQIPYIERSSLETKWHAITDFCGQQEGNLTVTKRCPIDVSYALSQNYIDIATTSNKAISVLPVGRCGEFYQIEPDTLILTFTQEEKQRVGETLKWSSHVKICTIHEAQGLTAKNVLLIRIDYRKKSIYDSMPHAIVALSRHTHKFKYITTGSDDAVEILLRRLRCIDEEGLIKWNSKQLLPK